MKNWDDNDSFSEGDEDFEFGQTDNKKPEKPRDDPQPQPQAANDEEEKAEPSDAQRDSRNDEQAYQRDRPPRERNERGPRNNRRQNNKYGGDKYDRPRNNWNQEGGEDAPLDEGQDGNDRRHHGNYNRQNKYNNRNNDRHQRKGDHFDQSEIDMNSNYRQYYCNDPDFFMKVLGQEPPPYNFKLHAFPNSRARHQASDDKEASEH